MQTWNRQGTQQHLTGTNLLWAASRENLISWFLTRFNTNRAVQPQKIVRGFKFGFGKYHHHHHHHHHHHIWFLEPFFLYPGLGFWTSLSWWHPLLSEWFWGLTQSISSFFLWFSIISSHDERDCIIYVAKTKALISCAVTAQLFCAFIFAYIVASVLLCSKWHLGEKWVILRTAYCWNRNQVSTCNAFACLSPPSKLKFAVLFCSTCKGLISFSAILF